jgi:hypothetical protein
MFFNGKRSYLMNRSILLFIVSGCLILAACNRQLPKKTYDDFYLSWEVVEAGDSLYFTTRNPLGCPIAFTIRASNDSIPAAFGDQIPRVLSPYESVRLKISGNWSAQQLKAAIIPYAIQSRLQTVTPDNSVQYVFPFPRGQAYPVIQAYGGAFSHAKSDFAYYAIDFKLPIGDTVCAARDGIVVGLIEENKDWIHGPNSRYRDYANYLRLYHADETYTDYVHLKYRGALVALGDTVQAGQPIGISGYTGWTSTPHLHFNTIMPTDKGTMVGFPVKFEKMAGKDIKEGMRVGH